MPKDTSGILGYVAVASLGAAALFYVLGPSLIPNEDFHTLKRHEGVGLLNSANDCFINAVLQALAASEKLTEYLRHVDDVS